MGDLISPYLTCFVEQKSMGSYPGKSKRHKEDEGTGDTVDTADTADTGQRRESTSECSDSREHSSEDHRNMPLFKKKDKKQDIEAKKKEAEAKKSAEDAKKKLQHQIYLVSVVFLIVIQ